jgi:predicted ATP-grasp superfamily ATP-dependent carboligase
MAEQSSSNNDIPNGEATSKLISGGAPVILGCESATALGIFRAIGRKGLRSAGLAFGTQLPPISFSRFGVVAIAKSRSTEIVDWLIKHACEADKNVLLCADDESVLFVDAHRDRLSKSYTVASAGKFTMTELMNKTFMSSIAAAAGFQIPKTVTAENLADVRHSAETLSSQTNAPWIAKSISSVEGQKNCFHVIHYTDELVDKFSETVSTAGRAMLQEYIETEETGGGGELLEVFAYRPPRSCGHFTAVIAKKLRIFPPAVGSSAWIETVSDDRLRSLCNHLLDQIGYEGIADIEVIRKDHKYWFIEMNCRAGTPIDLTAVAGINIPYIAVSKAIQDSTSNPIPRVRYMREPSEWQAAHHKTISLGQFLWEILTANTHLYLSWRDPLPAVIWLIRKLFSRRTADLGQK